MNLFDAKKNLIRKAVDGSVLNAETKARYIFEHYSGLSTEDLYRFRDDYDLEPWKYAQMVKAVHRLINGTPVQLITGKTHFYNDTFLCKKGVLIPRPETEMLVDSALKEMGDKVGGLRVLDLFTGAGVVPISIANVAPSHEYFGSDISRKAINLSKKNASRIGVTIDWREGDMFTPFEKELQPFDIITANPPYIRSGDIRKLSAEVRNGDPKLALDGGKDGLKFHRKLVKHIEKWLKSGGCLVCEMGYDQKKDIRELYKPAKVEFHKDLWKKDRIYIVRNG